MQKNKKWIILTCGILGAFAGPGIFAGISASWAELTGQSALTLPQPSSMSTLGASALGLFSGIILAALILVWARRFSSIWNNLDSGDKTTWLISFFAAMIVSIPFLAILSNLQPVIAFFMTLIIIVGVTNLMMSALLSMSDVLPWLRHKPHLRKNRIKILDTNVIIDGRIYDIIGSKFLDGNIYIPRFVLEELQHIADSQDSIRRQRGRRGLEVLRLLQSEFPLEIGTFDKMAPNADEEVDSRLVKLAKALNADIVTNDFNLNRVALLQDVNVLNINELAISLKPTVLPNEPLEIAVLREGNHPGQGVGYLEDGTMVVIDYGSKYIGETVNAIVSQVIQTERGRMIFAEVPEEPVEEEPLDAHFKRRKPVRT